MSYERGKRNFTKTREITVMKRIMRVTICVFIRAFLYTFSCVFVKFRSAFRGQLMRFRKTAQNE